MKFTIPMLKTLPLMLLGIGTAHADLIGVQRTGYDITLLSPTFIYDHNALDGGNTGLLVVVANSSTLNAPGGSSMSTQANPATGQDSASQLLLSFAINPTTGQLVSNSTYNRVNIAGTNASGANYIFSWTGIITGFGFETDVDGVGGAGNGDGTFFDATWTMTGDSYAGGPLAGQHLAPNNGGGIKLNAVGVDILSARSGGTALTDSSLFMYSWTLGSLADGRLNDADFIPAIDLAASTVAGTYYFNASNSQTADVFLPLPGAAILLLSGLGLLAPLRRRVVHELDSQLQPV